MLSVNAESIGIAHRDAVMKVCTFGTADITEDGEHVVKLEVPLCIHVSYPLHEYSKFVSSPYGRKFDDIYVTKVTGITKRNNDGLDPTYTYGNRFRDYLSPVSIPMYSQSPHVDPQTYYLHGDGNLGGYDQLEACIKKLQKNLSTRRAIMVTWIPWKDHESEEPPCVVVVDLKVIQENVLTLVAYIRSNDILMAWGENAIGLLALQQRVAERLHLNIGYLETISRDAHVYYKRDQSDLRTMGIMYDI